MGTLIIKYPDFKGFFTSFYNFYSIGISFLISAMSTFFFTYGYNLKLNPKLPSFNHLFTLKDDWYYRKIPNS